jgi:hypothetical protein
MEHVDTITSGKKKLIRTIKNSLINFEQLMQSETDQKWLAPMILEDYMHMMRVAVKSAQEHPNKMAGVMLYGG